MRRLVITAFVFVLVFLVACTNNSVESALREQESVKLFTAMNDNVQYSQTQFSGAQADAMADLVNAECPGGTSKDFIRATFITKAATLVIYTTDGKNITCSILKPGAAKEIQYHKHVEAPNQDTAVVVNGQTITIKQVQDAIAALPASTPKDDAAVNLVLNQLINNALLQQQAVNITVDDKDLADTEDVILLQTGVSRDELLQELTKQGKTEGDFRETLRDQAKLSKLLREKLLLTDINVSAQTAQDVYLQNPNQFLQTEQAVMRQIFISSTGRTLEQGQARLQEIAAKLNNTDFCALVKQYSDDTQRKDQCGVYIVPRGVLDSNLELAAFSTPANQTAVVATAGGISLVQTLQVVPPQVVPYAKVEEQLRNTIANSLFQQRLSLYTTLLRSNAQIDAYVQ